jgi:hypothetical protein
MPARVAWFDPGRPRRVPFHRREQFSSLMVEFTFLKNVSNAAVDCP